MAIEFTKRVWLPDVIHCHDWQSALVPLLLRKQHANDPGVRVTSSGFDDPQPGIPGCVSTLRFCQKSVLPETVFTHPDARASSTAT